MQRLLYFVILLAMIPMNEIKIPKNLVGRYPGKRVAIVDGKVVVVATNARICYERAKRKYPEKEILVYHVPRKEERYHLYRLCVCLTKKTNRG